MLLAMGVRDCPEQVEVYSQVMKSVGSRVFVMTVIQVIWRSGRRSSAMSTSVAVSVWWTSLCTAARSICSAT